MQCRARSFRWSTTGSKNYETILHQKHVATRAWAKWNKLKYFEQWILILKNIKHHWRFQEYVIQQFNTIDTVHYFAKHFQY